MSQLTIHPLRLKDLLLIRPQVHTDAHGVFVEQFNQQDFEQQTGQQIQFVQDNLIRSYEGVLHGLHYQVQPTQAKLVQLLQGEIYAVMVDLRPQSSTFKQWEGIHLAAEQRVQLWIPAGFAYGFLTLSGYADILYKTDGYYTPENEVVIAWDDADLNIQWPLPHSPTLSLKDQQGMPLNQAAQALF